MSTDKEREANIFTFGALHHPMKTNMTNLASTWYFFRFVVYSRCHGLLLRTVLVKKNETRVLLVNFGGQHNFVALKGWDAPPNVFDFWR